jgi:hypothetical protein
MSADSKITRPGFKSGLHSLPEIRKADSIKTPPRTTKAEDVVGSRPSFVNPDIKSRFIQDFSRIRQLDLENEGLKVQFGPSTLAKLLEVEMPDENNPSVLIKKNVSLSQLLKTQSGRLAGISSLINRLRRDSNRNSAQSRNTMNMLATMIVQSLTDVIEKGSKFTASKLNLLLKGLKFIDIPKDPIQAGFKNKFATKADLVGGNSGMLLAYLLKESNIDDINLSVGYPVYGVSGVPITIQSMVSGLSKNQVLDIQSRQMYKNMADYIRGTGSQFQSYFNDPQGFFGSPSGPIVSNITSSSGPETGLGSLSLQLQQQGISQQTAESIASDLPQFMFNRIDPYSQQVPFSQFIRPQVSPELQSDGTVRAILPPGSLNPRSIEPEEAEFESIEDFQDYLDFQRRSQERILLEDEEKVEEEATKDIKDYLEAKKEEERIKRLELEAEKKKKKEEEERKKEKEKKKEKKKKKKKKKIEELPTDNVSLKDKKGNPIPMAEMNNMQLYKHLKNNTTLSEEDLQKMVNAEIDGSSIVNYIKRYKLDKVLRNVGLNIVSIEKVRGAFAFVEPD